jgi:hypothetical protein
MASKEEIHRLATKAGIPWDDDANFMKWSKRVTGKAHLDGMTPDQLEKMKSAIEQRMTKEAQVFAYAFIDELEKLSSL